MRWYIAALKKYMVFSGRAGRKEYWMFILCNTIVICAAMAADFIISGKSGINGHGLISSFYVFATILPSVAITVRRLHDSDHSGLWILILIVPVIGYLWIIWFMCLRGTPRENRFGPNPLWAQVYSA